MHRYVYRYEGHPDLFAKMRQLVKEERAQNLTGDLTNYCFEKKSSAAVSKRAYQIPPRRYRNNEKLAAL